MLPLKHGKRENTMKTCAICGSLDMKRLEGQTVESKFKTSNGIKTFKIEGLSCTKCNNCGEEYLNPDDIKLETQKLKEALAEHRKNKGLLTAEEIKEIRDSLEMSQAEIEKMLGFSSKSFARWETYKADQSKAADLLLRAIKKGGKQFLDSLLSEQNPKIVKKQRAA